LSDTNKHLKWINDSIA